MAGAELVSTFRTIRLRDSHKFTQPQNRYDPGLDNTVLETFVLRLYGLNRKGGFFGDALCLLEVSSFVDQQARMVEKMKSTEHLDLEKIVITSPVAAAVTYSLMDAYRIIVVHERRHFEQARRVTEEAAFPV